MQKATHPSLLWIALVGCGLASSCADADGNDPYALWDTYTHADKLYSFRYLAPPWELIHVGEDADLQAAAVDPSSDGMDASIETGALHARFKSVVSVRDESSAEDAAEADLERLQEIAAETGHVEPFKSMDGYPGFHLSARFTDRNLRAVYFSLSDHRVVVMQLAGRESIDGADFTLFLRGLEPEGDGN